MASTLGIGNRIVVDPRNSGISLAQAIILAEYGDTIIVQRESEKALGETIARQRRPGVKITFEVEDSQGWTQLLRKND